LEVKRPSKPVLTLDLDHAFSFSQTRNRQSCPKFQCYGSLRVLFPPEGQDAFVFPNNPSADIAIHMTHIEHLGRTTKNGVPIPVREWIRNNPRPSSQIQRDDLLRAIARDELPGVVKDYWMSPAHVHYWWKKMQAQTTHISDDPWINLEHALRQDPKVFPILSTLITESWRNSVPRASHSSILVRS
jgi:hypothetical protein